MERSLKPIKRNGRNCVFLAKGIADKHDYIKVISDRCWDPAYVGDTWCLTLRKLHDERKWNFNAIATTDIVANPETYLKKRW